MHEKPQQSHTDEGWMRFLLQPDPQTPQLFENLFRAAVDITDFPLVQVLRLRYETHLRVEALVDQIGVGYRAGAEFPLEDVLDKEVIRKKDSIVIPDISTTSLVRTPAVNRYGIRSYIGTPIILKNQQLYGVLSLFDRESHVLGPDVLLRISLLGQWLSKEIELRQMSKELSTKNNRVAALAQELQRLQTQVEQGSIRDPITDLLNSRYFNKLLQTEASRAQRHAYPLSLLLVFPDGLPSLRRQLGLDAGNSILSSMGVLLRRYLRTIDSAARYSEEIFAILLPQTDHVGASIVAERIRSTISMHAFTGAGPNAPSLSLTASIGISDMLSFEDNPAAAIFSRARKALEQARSAGGNRVVIAPTSSN